MVTEIGPIKQGGKADNLTSAAFDVAGNSKTVQKAVNTTQALSTKQTNTFSFLSIKNHVNVLLNSDLSESEKDDLVYLFKVLEPVNITNSKTLMQEIIFKIQNSGIFYPKNIKDLINVLFESGINESLREEFFNGVAEKLLITDLYAIMNRVLKILKNKKFTGQKDLSKASKGLKRECKNLMKFLDKQQDKTLHPDTKDSNLMFVLPWQESNQPIFIRTGLNYSGKNNENYTVFDLLISLKNIGTVRVNLLSIGKAYVLKLFVQTDEVRNYLQAKIELLSKSLKEQLRGINCIVQTSIESTSSFFQKDEEIPFMHHVDIKA